MMVTLLRDIRYTFRVLGKKPGFALVAILSLALGIGANVAVFSVVNLLLFKPMPVREPGRLAALYITEPQTRMPSGFSYPDYLDYSENNEAFTELMGFTGIPLNLSVSGGQPELIWGEMVTGNYFSGLGVEPVLGRGFLPEEGQTPNASPVAVISYNFWQRRFNADPDIAGKVVKLNKHDFTIVGVAPFGFTGAKFLGFIPDFWVPVMMHEQVWPDSENILTLRTSHFLSLRGRLKDGVSLEQAEAAMNVRARQLEEAYPQTNKNMSVNVIDGSTKVEPYITTTGAIPIITSSMMAIVGLVLLIACANVANLLLARASGRRREIAIRLALGASRARLIRQLLTESMILSLAGGGLGLLLALWFGDLLMAFYPVLDFNTVEPAYDLSLDWRVISFSLAVSLITGLVFGLVPALQASKPDLVPTLKGEAGSALRGPRRLGLSNVLVIAQVALSLVLLITAGLFIRSVQNAQQIDPGFDTKNIILASTDLGVQGYKEDKGKDLYKQMVERVRALPGVEAAAVAFPLPLDAYDYGTRVDIEGYTPPPDEGRPRVGYTIAGPGYFQAMGTRIVEGRDFTERDDKDAPRAVIVNETLARLYWPDQNPIGKRVRVGNERNPFSEVVGVAEDGKYMTLGEAPTPYMFLPLGQNYDGRMTLIVRGADPKQLVPSIREEVRALDETLPVFGIKTIQEFMTKSLAGAQSAATFIGLFGLLAMLLAAIGIYGVMNYSVSTRTREIGIRMALGAGRFEVLKMVLKQGMFLAGLGLVIGLGGAYFLTRLMSSLLFGVSARDQVTFIAISLLLALVALAACYIPARRATKVDPMVALRYE
jgi:predicted permease